MKKIVLLCTAKKFMNNVEEEKIVYRGRRTSGPVPKAVTGCMTLADSAGRFSTVIIDRLLYAATVVHGIND